MNTEIIDLAARLGDYLKSRKSMIALAESCTGGAFWQAVTEMTQGTISNSQADCAIAVTGFAGPGGGTSEKPVGTVYLGFCQMDGTLHHSLLRLEGNRQSIRLQTVKVALTSFVTRQSCPLTPIPSSSFLLS